MTKIKRISKAMVVGLAALVLAPAAMAQATRTWVSGVGDDANPCSRTAPCKTFAGAISKTAIGGIINALDPGGFGAVTITKSITIDGGGFPSGILAAGTNGVIVNIASGRVVLRNLSIEGIGTGLIGVNVVSAGTYVSIERSRISGFRSGTAVGVRANQAVQLTVKDSVIADNGIGLQLAPPSGFLVATLDNVLVQDSTTDGVHTAGAGTTRMVIKRSTISNNLQQGVNANSALSIVSVTDSTLSFNWGTALRAGVAGARIRISGNAIVENPTPLSFVGGAFIESDGTNRIAPAGLAPNGAFNNQ
jgi:hypothetical protein